jgi:transposase
MSMGRRKGKQTSMWLAGSQMAQGPRNVFYEQLNKELNLIDFDRRVEGWCAPYFEAPGRPGRPSVPPGVYFRMLFVGYFEGIEAERGIDWRCSDSLSLKRFLGFEPHEATPDHSTLSRTRHRLGSEVFESVFTLVLGLVDRRGLLRGKTLGVDGTMLRADASMKAIVRKDTGEGYQDYLRGLAKADGIEEPTADDLRRMDRKRAGKKTSNKDWKSSTDGDARIGRLKDGRTRLAYKAEHVVDMESGVIVSAELFLADSGDTLTMQDSLDQARDNVRDARSDEHEADREDDEPPASGSGSPREAGEVVEVVADKGYHKASLLLELKEAGYRTYIPERKQKGKRRWKRRANGRAQKAAFHENRARVARTKSKALQRKRGELVERTMAHLYETGGHRRVRLRGAENVRKRLLLHAAAANIGRVMRLLCKSGTPRGYAARAAALCSSAWVFAAAFSARLSSLTARAPAARPDRATSERRRARWRLQRWPSLSAA